MPNEVMPPQPAQNSIDEIKSASTVGSPLLDAVKATLVNLEKTVASAKDQADRLEKLRSEQLLSGTAGGGQKIVPAKEETPKEYRKRIMDEVRSGKYND